MRNMLFCRKFGKEIKWRESEAGSQKSEVKSRKSEDGSQESGVGKRQIRKTEPGNT